MVAQGLRGDLAIFEADDKGALFAGPRDAGVDVVDVDLRFEQCTEDELHIAFSSNLDDENLAFGEGEIVLIEQGAGFVGIINDHTNDGAVGRVENGKRQHVDVVAIEETDKIGEPADLVFRKDGKLSDWLFAAPFGGSGLHQWNPLVRRLVRARSRATKMTSGQAGGVADGI